MQKRQDEVRDILERVEETNHPAFFELKEKIRNPKYEFSDSGVKNTLKSYGLLDEREEVAQSVKEIIQI